MVKAELAVISQHWQPLVLNLAISRLLPARYTFCLRSYGVQLRRLDVRGSAHRNPVALGGQFFRAGTTHKHAWKDDHNDSWAYAPADIPVQDRPPCLTPDEYRLAFEAFAKECHIELDAGSGYRWVEPDVPQRQARL